MTERVFGRRGFPEATSASPSNFAAWLGLDAVTFDGAPAFVPTSLRGAALAAFGLFLFQCAILIARSRGFGAGVALAVNPNVLVLGPAPGLVFVTAFGTLAWGACQVAAVYSFACHAVLRWLGMSSPAAYAFGGASVGYVFLATWAANGYHLRLDGSLVELAGGALTCALYRFGAGLAPRGAAARG